MKFNLLTSALALASGALSLPSEAGLEKRNPTGSFELVAYDVTSTYIKLFYSDGLAYAGDSSLWTHGKVTTDVTFVINDTKITTTATTSGVTLDSDTLLYIRPTADKVLPVGFTGNGYTTPSDAVSDNFLFYGTYLMWEEAGGNLADSFRVKETNVSGVYQVYWDTSNLYPSGYGIPVVKSL
ncbi:uncharacterized protein N7459_000546 [Penicillium hispanicum]|uniref:uncharacterized protein n=1 Tax=Penicillium hispanicum TaxID=1080232 RepID=UPI0025405267|nr:uncharacterized protein N7459_000546 [Penicillium hispanicum]KAJ5594338.1 hypothetical protein N7459_000546 [Penicillium hispanicum]